MALTTQSDTAGKVLVGSILLKQLAKLKEGRQMVTTDTAISSEQMSPESKTKGMSDGTTINWSTETVEITDGITNDDSSVSTAEADFSEPESKFTAESHIVTTEEIRGGIVTTEDIRIDPITEQEFRVDVTTEGMASLPSTKEPSV